MDELMGVPNAAWTTDATGDWLQGSHFVGQGDKMSPFPVNPGAPAHFVHGVHEPPRRKRLSIGGHRPPLQHTFKHQTNTLRESRRGGRNREK